MVNKTNSQRMKELEEENRALREKIDSSKPTDDLSRYMSDINFLEKSKVNLTSSNKIQVKEITDHKNISLWTKWGKRVGPTHPGNAENTYRKFYALSQRPGKSYLRLLVVEPSEKEISSWLQTEEGKLWQEDNKKNRDRKIKTKKKGEVDRLISAMSKQYGINANEVNSIKSPEEVGVAA